MAGADAADEVEELERAGVRRGPFARLFAREHTYVFARFLFLRLLGLVYLVGFLVALRQGPPLIGHDGLLPADVFLERVAHALGSRSAGFFRLPSIFWLGAGDGAIRAAAWIGLGLSACVCAGATNALVMAALWALYLSFVHVGQVFYGYGWEVQLCETGFLAIFLCPVRSVTPFPEAPPSRVSIVLLRWLVARVMLGAGLIKLRGDPCWRDLTCLVYHYETQPNPNPVAWLLNQAPRWFHELGALVNHAVEIVAPFFVFGPRRARIAAGAAIIAFQATLIVSGNLSFLNWLTICPAIACFDDRLLRRIAPRAFADRVVAAAEAHAPTPAARGVAIALGVLVAFLSIGPVDNLLSSRQAMNTTFEPFDLVNTYGAFGSVSRERREVILEGTSDAHVDERTTWREYELPCAPGDVRRAPCV
ncbi:MAG TPA: lipase maturation factor family protein, partial [Minicystis sp.]|nr:lipase maturation factor family protein [Minicystis sp.]